MFNTTLRKEALRIHGETLEKYNKNYKKMGDACELLYDVQSKSVDLINTIQRLINSIANSSKEFDVKSEKIGIELAKFTETKDYEKKAYESSLMTGVIMAGGLAAGIGIASMAQNTMEKITTSWTEKALAGLVIKESVGMAARRPVLALAGPIGWGISAVSIGASLISLTNKNKEIAQNAIEEAKEIAIAREVLDEATMKICALKTKTNSPYLCLNKQRDKFNELMNSDYSLLSDEDKKYLGTLVENTLSLAELLNETID